MCVAVLCVTSYQQQTEHFCLHRPVLLLLCAFVDVSFKPSWYHFIFVLGMPQIQPVGGLGCWLPCCPAVCHLPSMSSISGTVRCPTPPALSLKAWTCRLTGSPCTVTAAGLPLLAVMAPGPLRGWFRSTRYTVYYGCSDLVYLCLLYFENCEFTPFPSSPTRFVLLFSLFSRGESHSDGEEPGFCCRVVLPQVFSESTMMFPRDC